MKRFLIVWLAGVGFWATAAAAAGTAVDLPVERHILDNGLTVLLLENHESPTLGLVTAFRVGSGDEWDGVTGITHILEHMLFKGGEKVGTKNYAQEKKLLARIEELAQEIKRRENPGPGEAPADSAQLAALEREFKEVQDAAREFVVPNELWETYQNEGGINLNADTGPDITRYYLALPANRLEHWLYLESERLRHPILREFYTEVKNVAEEYRLGVENQPDGALWELITNTSFQAHNYGTMVIGWPSDVATVTRTEVEQYFQRYYAPNQMVLAVVGDMDAKKTLEMVKAYFGDIPRQPRPEPVETVEPPQRGERRVEREFDANPQVMIGFRRAEGDHPDEPVYRVVTEILNGGRSSRFNKNIVEGTQIAASFYIDPHGVGEKYPTLYLIQGVPRAPHTTLELEAAVYEELDRLKKEPVGARELEKAQNQLEADFVRGLESNFGLAREIASYEATYDDWQTMLRMREDVARVTAEDIMRVARQDFRRTSRTVATLVPLSAEAAPVSAAAAAQAEALLARTFAALGGAEALAAVKDITSDSDISITTPGGAFPATSHAEMLLPDRVRSEFSFMGQTQVQGHDGTSWYVSVMGQVQDFPPDRLKEANASWLRDSFFFRYPLLKETLRLELVPKDAEGLEGLQVIAADGSKFRLFLDGQTGLPRRMEYDTTNPMTGQPAKAVDIITDYQKVGGVLFAHRTQTLLDGKEFTDQRVRTLEVNRGLAPDKFRRPQG